MNSIKIQPKNTTTDVGSICLTLDISNVYDLQTPAEIKKQIDMFLEVTNCGYWSLGRQTRQNRMDLMLTDIESNDMLPFVEGLIKEYNRFIRENTANIDKIPKSIVVELEYNDIFLHRELLSLINDSAIPVYVSILDKYCTMTIETMEYIQSMIGGLNGTKLFYTLLVNDTISAQEFEQNRVDKEHFFKWFKLKSCIVYSLDESINLIKFAFEYGFKYYHPTVINYSSLSERVENINISLNKIMSQLNDLNDILSKE